LKLIIHISFLLITVLSFAQKEPTKTVDIVNKGNKKLHFEDIKIESEAKDKYKTLEIRYKKLDSPTQAEVVIETVSYKCFENKQAAVRYYFAVKKTAPTKVVYYVYSTETKKPEIITFRVN
jgi:hypothetical protein